MMHDELVWIREHSCPNCANRKPDSSNDCSIYQTVFVQNSPMVLANIDKLFKKDTCLSFAPKNS